MSLCRILRRASRPDTMISKFRITASLRHLAFSEGTKVDVRRVPVDALDRQHDVLQEIREARALAAHTGSACASTALRNRSGRAAGVRTSTGTPSSSSSSAPDRPRSKSVVSVVASTRRSRSLPSASSPVATEPKTRAFPCAVDLDDASDGLIPQGDRRLHGVQSSLSFAGSSQISARNRIGSSEAGWANPAAAPPLPAPKDP